MANASYDNKGTYTYYDGTVCAYAAAQFTSSGYLGVNVGGQYNSSSYKASNTSVKYIAILNSSKTSDISAWSLTNMTSAATFTDGGTISSNTNYTATGINLNGGTVTVSGEITAAAIFVQADTTLNMVPGTDKLVSTGPVYVADGVTLIINTTANPSDYVAGTALSKDLLTGTLYVSDSIVKAGTLADVSAGRTAISVDTTNNKVSWAYTPMPVWSDGAWLNDNEPDGNTTEIAIDSSTSATFNAGGSYSAVYVIGTGTLAIGADDGLTATTLDVASGASINMENMTATTITGAGTVIYDGTTPSSTIDASWSGTVWVKNILQASNVQLLPNSWGNSSSVLRFTNVTGWLANDTVCTVPVELVDDGSNAAFTLHYTTAPTTTLTFNEFRGSGTFATTAADSTWPAVTHKVLKWNSFTGSLNIDRGRFVFGTGTFSQWRCICVSANQSVEVASGATWTGSTGFVVDSGATLTATGTLAYGGLDGNAVSGSGTVVFDGKTPNTGTGWWTTSGWTGTVWVKNINPISSDVRNGYTKFSPNDYGWTGSTLKVTGIKGFISGETSGFTINPKLELEDGTAGYGLWLSDGYGFNSDDGNYSVLTELKGTGSLIGSGNGDNVMLMVRKWSDFAGTLSLTNKVVVFGTTKPTKDTINYGGYIIVDTDQSVTIPSTKTWYAERKIIVNGTLSATDKDRWASTVLVNDDGVLELTSTSNTNESSSGSNKDYSSVTGTGTLKYTSSSGWRTFPNDDAKMPATTLTLQVEVADSLIITKGDATDPTTIGSLSGTKNIRSDWEQVTGASTARLLNINQTKDTTWSGHTANGDRIDTITVSGGGTLTLAASENGNADKLAVATTGSVNLSGLWNGDTTVSGTFGGTGTLTGNLTFNAGSTFKAFASDTDGLAVSGTITYPAEGTVTVDVSALTETTGKVVLMTATNATLTATNFALASGNSGELVVEDYALKVDFTAYAASFNGVKYETIAEAIAAAEQAGQTYAAVTILDANATCPDEYYIDNGILAKKPAAVCFSGALTYYTTAEAAFAAAYMSTMGTNPTGYDYMIFYANAAITAFDGMKIKPVSGVTVTINATSAEYEVTPGEADESGVVTYTVANAPTTYTWTDAWNDTDYQTSESIPNHDWTMSANWSFNNGTVATRYPGAADTVIIGDGANITGVSSPTSVAVMQVSGAVTISGGGSLTATTGGIVLTDAAATLTVSGGVSLSPAPTTNVGGGATVKRIGDTYKVVYGTIFSVY